MHKDAKALLGRASESMRPAIDSLPQKGDG